MCSIRLEKSGPVTDDRSHLVPPALLTAVLAISCAAIFFRLASPTHPLASAAIRLGIAAMLLSPFVVRARRQSRLDARILRHAVVAGVFYALHFGTWVWSLELTSVAASVTLVTATPLLLAMWGFCTGIDRPDRRLWLALALALAGIVTIGGVDFGTSTAALVGDVLAFTGAAAMAGYMLVVRRLGPIDVFAFMGIAAAVGAVLLAATGFLAQVPMAPAAPSALFFLALSALIPQIIGHSLLTWSLRWARPTTVGIATLGEPVGAATLAYLVLGETVTATTLIGCVITVSAVAVALRASRPRA